MHCFHEELSIHLYQAELGRPGEVQAVAGTLPGHVDVLYSSPPNHEHHSYWRTAILHEDTWSAFVELVEAVDPDVLILDVMSLTEQAADTFGPEWPYLYRRPVVYEAPMSANGQGRASKPGFTQLVFSRRSLAAHPAGFGSRDALAELIEQMPRGVMFDPFVGKGLAMQEAYARGWDFWGSDCDPERLTACVNWLERI